MKPRTVGKKELRQRQYRTIAIESLAVRNHHIAGSKVFGRQK